MIKIRRVYEEPDPAGGRRFLVDRLWPRGLRKESLPLDGWPKEVAPSNALRAWFHTGSGPWEAFRERYFQELDARPEAWQPLLAAVKKGPVTLLYAAKDTERNNAAALRDYLEVKLAEESQTPSPKFL
jgi:uncharacterized protein YeaO (DUF488 family)